MFSSRIQNAHLHCSSFDISSPNPPRLTCASPLISVPTQTSHLARNRSQWRPRYFLFRPGVESHQFPSRKKTAKFVRAGVSATVPSPTRRCSRESRLMPSGAAISILRSFDRSGCLAFASVHKLGRLSKRGISHYSINDRKILLCTRGFLQRGKEGQMLMGRRRRRWDLFLRKRREPPANRLMMGEMTHVMSRQAEFTRQLPENN